MGKKLTRVCNIHWLQSKGITLRKRQFIYRKAGITLRVASLVAIEIDQSE